MLFHVKSILVGIKMGIFHGIGSSAVSEDLLCDVDAGHFIKMGGSRMSE